MPAVHEIGSMLASPHQEQDVAEQHAQDDDDDRGGGRGEPSGRLATRLAQALFTVSGYKRGYRRRRPLTTSHL